MKLKQLVVVTCLAACGSAFGSATLGFSLTPAENFANAAGVPTNGLFYGVIIDASGNGYSGSYRPVILASGAVFGLTTSTDISSDDVLVLSSGLTYSDTTTPGTIFDVGSFPYDSNVNQGDSFRIVWFDGDAIGTLSDASFLLPTAGNLTDYDAPFVGSVDPVRSAGLAYSGTSSVSTGSGFTFVPIPEPSAALLGVIGAFSLLHRRRI